MQLIKKVTEIIRHNGEKNLKMLENNENCCIGKNGRRKIDNS